MSVEDVNNPKTVKEVDPKAAKEDQGDGTVAYYENLAKIARAKHDYKAEEEALKMLGRQPEPAFQVKGSLDLGNMNPALQAKEAQERADKQAEGKDKTIKEANERAATAEANLQDEKVDGLRRDFGAQMAVLNTTIEKLITAKDPRPLSEQFKEQFATAKEIADSMGMGTTSNGQDPMVAIELKKMEFAEAQRAREFQLQIAHEDRAWQVHLIELKDNREFRKAELAQNERKTDMIAGFPAVIGSVLSKGTKASAGAGGQTVGEKAWKVQLSEGETNEFDCPTPGCGARVGIGPTTEIAQCVKCQRQYPVERTAVPAGEGSIEEPIPSEEE